MARPPMSNAKVNPRISTLGVYPDGTLDVRCWCEAEVVNVHRSLLLAGRTGSCGLECTPENISACPPRERPWRYKSVR